MTQALRVERVTLEEFKVVAIGGSGRLRSRFHGEHHIRERDGWRQPVTLASPGAVIRLARFRAQIALSAVCRNVLDPEAA